MTLILLYSEHRICSLPPPVQVPPTCRRVLSSASPSVGSLLRQNSALRSLTGDVETAFSRELQPLQLTPARLEPLVGRLADLLTDQPPTRLSGAARGSQQGGVQGAKEVS